MSAAPRLYLIDASIYIFRSYFSIPGSFFAASGELVNAVYGYTQFLLDLLDLEPDRISVAFDESLVSCYRNQIYPAYKANRDLPDDNLKYQLKKCQQVTALLGFHSLCLKDYEADDIIGTLLTRFGADSEVIIVTRDKDLGQLLRPQDRLWDFAADQYAAQADVEKKFGVRPDQLADFLALAGDSVDNIPGARGIGAKTAAALLNQFGSLDALLEDIPAVASMSLRGAKKIAGTLADSADEVRMYREITGIHCAVPMQVSEADLQLRKVDRKKLLAFCDEMAFGDRIRQRVEALVTARG